MNSVKLIFIAGLVLVACGAKGKKPTPTATPEPTSTPSTMPVPTPTPLPAMTPPPPPELHCEGVNVKGTVYLPNGFSSIARCENDEVICWITDWGSKCRWK
jgi:hypothetical protein